MTASRGVVQRFVQRREISWSPNYLFFYVVRICMRGSPVYHQHTLKLIMLEFANTRALFTNVKKARLATYP